MFSAGIFLGYSSKIITDYQECVYGDEYKVEIVEESTAGLSNGR